MVLIAEKALTFAMKWNILAAERNKENVKGKLLEREGRKAVSLKREHNVPAMIVWLPNFS